MTCSDKHFRFKSYNSIFQDFACVKRALSENRLGVVVYGVAMRRGFPDEFRLEIFCGDYLTKEATQWCS